MGRIMNKFLLLLIAALAHSPNGSATPADPRSVQWSSPAINDEISCPYPYEAVGDQCILFSLIHPGVYVEGKLTCQSFEGHLVAIHTATQMENIINQIIKRGFDDKPFWIDGSDASKEGKWVYASGDPFVSGTPFWLASETYQEPDNLEDIENCAGMMPEDSYFINDENCSESCFPICEITPLEVSAELKGNMKAPTECPVFFVDVGGICLALLTWEEVAWNDARASCHGISGELAHFDNIEQFRALYLYLQDSGISKHSFWIGGSDTEEEGDWIYTTSEPVPIGSPWWGCDGNYTIGWDPEPNGDTVENCLGLIGEGAYYFRDKSCDLLMNPLCRQVLLD